MRKILITLGLAVLMIAAPTFVPDASADSNWFAGTGFRIGPVAFSLVLGSPNRGPESYYWRTSERIAYRGYRCSDACFLDHGTNYHHSACPVVRRHLDHYGYDAGAVFTRYAPRHDDYGYRDRRYDDRRSDDRYDRRYDDRYDDYDRGHDRWHRDHDRRDDRRHDRRDRRRH